jgi:hypothetical protein
LIQQQRKSHCGVVSPCRPQVQRDCWPRWRRPPPLQRDSNGPGVGPDQQHPNSTFPPYNEDDARSPCQPTQGCGIRGLYFRTEFCLRAKCPKWGWSFLHGYSVWPLMMSSPCRMAYDLHVATELSVLAPPRHLLGGVNISKKCALTPPNRPAGLLGRGTSARWLGRAWRSTGHLPVERGTVLRDVYSHISPLDAGTALKQLVPAWLPTREVSEMAVKRWGA